MTISIVIVSWNARQHLTNCLLSIRDQRTSARVEVIVVDNASTDGSPETVAAEFPQVILIRNSTNVGFSKANNIGIRAASGERLLLINSDIIVRPGCFAAMLDYMDRDPTVGVLGPKILGADGRVQRSCMGYPSLWNYMCRSLALDRVFPRSPLVGGQLLSFWNHDETRAVDVINGCFWMVRREAIEEVGLLDERFFIYGEDVDWCRRFNERGWRVVFFHRAEAVHFGGGSSSNAPVRFYLEMQRANYQYWRKHHSRAESNGFLLLNVVHHSIRLIGAALQRVMRPAVGPGVSYAAPRSVAALKWALRELGTSVRPGGN